MASVRALEATAEKYQLSNKAMDIRNIEGFKLDHPGKEFPQYRSLQEDEMADIRTRLKIAIGMPEAADNLTLSKGIAALQGSCSAENANRETFNLSDTLKGFDVHPEPLVYVDFYRYDDVDELRAEDVIRYFPYIWYPGSDDISIFDRSLKWVLSISHDGEVTLIRLSPSTLN